MKGGADENIIREKKVFITSWLMEHSVYRAMSQHNHAGPRQDEHFVLSELSKGKKKQEGPSEYSEHQT